MKQFSLNKVLFRGLVYLLLIGQLWSNAFYYLNYFQGDEITAIELIDLEERNGEEEKEETESKELQEHDFILADLGLLAGNQGFDWSYRLNNTYHLEINTPPPQFLVRSFLA